MTPVRRRWLAALVVATSAACASAPEPRPARRGALPTPTPIPTGVNELRAAMRARGYTDSVYIANEAEQPVRLLPGNVGPKYPPTLWAASTEGAVLTQFVVDTMGLVIPGSLNVLRSSHEEFTNAVRTAVYAMRYSPAQHRGRKVIQAVQQPFEFRLER